VLTHMGDEYDCLLMWPPRTNTREHDQLTTVCIIPKAYPSRIRRRQLPGYTFQAPRQTTSSRHSAPNKDQTHALVTQSSCHPPGMEVHYQLSLSLSSRRACDSRTTPRSRHICAFPRAKYRVGHYTFVSALRCFTVDGVNCGNVREFRRIPCSGFQVASRRTTVSTAVCDSCVAGGQQHYKQSRQGGQCRADEGLDGVMR